LDVRELGEGSMGEMIPYEANITKKAIDFYVDAQYGKRDVAILVDGRHVYTGIVGKDAIVHVKKDSKAGKVLARALAEGNEVELQVMLG